MDKTKIIIKNKIGFAITAVLILAIVALLVFNKINVSIDQQSIVVRSSLEKAVIDIDDIISLEKITSIDVGKRVLGADLIKIYSGTFKNEPYGRYRLYIYKDVKEYILIEQEAGYVVLNQSTKELTDQLYDAIYAAYSD